jgi:hypothetical protein
MEYDIFSPLQRWFSIQQIVTMVLFLPCWEDRGFCSFLQRYIMFRDVRGRILPDMDKSLALFILDSWDSDLAKDYSTIRRGRAANLQPPVG